MIFCHCVLRNFLQLKKFPIKKLLKNIDKRSTL